MKYTISMRALLCISLVSASIGLGVSYASAADDCITESKLAPPKGSRWAYHTDRATNRKCWFLMKVTIAPAVSQTRRALPQFTLARILARATRNIECRANRVSRQAQTQRIRAGDFLPRILTLEGTAECGEQRHHRNDALAWSPPAGVAERRSCGGSKKKSPTFAGLSSGTRCHNSRTTLTTGSLSIFAATYG